MSTVGLLAGVIMKKRLGSHGVKSCSARGIFYIYNDSSVPRHVRQLICLAQCLLLASIVLHIFPQTLNDHVLPPLSSCLLATADGIREDISQDQLWPVHNWSQEAWLCSLPLIRPL